MTRFGISVRDICLFLSEYAACLVSGGATCIRVEKNVTRMSVALGVQTEMRIMPAHISVYVRNIENTASFTNIVRVAKTGISFDINTKLSKLSWNVADGKVTFDEAKAIFENIKTTKPADKNIVLLLVSIANMSFCRLFGGDIWSMLIVFAATFAGFKLRQEMIARKVDIRFVFFCCAFVSSLIGSLAQLYHLGDTPEIAIGSSILYLIPGIPYINSVSDMFDGHYLCSFSRFMDAIFLTVSLSFGLCMGMLLTGMSLF